MRIYSKVEIQEDFGAGAEFLAAGTYLVEMPDDYIPWMMTGEDLVNDRSVRIVERVPGQDEPAGLRWSIPTTWQENGSSLYDEASDVPADSALLGIAQLGTCMLHVQAMRVQIDDDGWQVAEDPAYRGDLERVLDICGDGPLETVKIPGFDGEYAIVAYPFAS